MSVCHFPCLTDEKTEANAIILFAHIQLISNWQSWKSNLSTSYQSQNPYLSLRTLQSRFSL